MFAQCSVSEAVGGKFLFPCPRLSEKGKKRRGQVGIGNVLQRECVTAANCGVNTEKPAISKYWVKKP